MHQERSHYKNKGTCTIKVVNGLCGGAGGERNRNILYAVSGPQKAYVDGVHHDLQQGSGPKQLRSSGQGELSRVAAGQRQCGRPAAMSPALAACPSEAVEEVGEVLGAGRGSCPACLRCDTGCKSAPAVAVHL